MIKIEAFADDQRPGSWLRRVMLGIYLALSCRIFVYLPGMRLIEELCLALGAVVFLIVYPILKNRSDWKFHPFDLYVLFLFFMNALVPAFAARSQFGQPITYGILAQRRVIFFLCLLLLFEAVRQRIVYFSDIQKSVLFVGWLTAAINTVLVLTTSPNPSQQAANTFQSGMLAAIPFSIFGLFYYASLANQTRKIKYYIYSGLMFAGSFGRSGRFMSICVSLTLVYFLFRRRRVERALLFIARAAAIGSTIIGIAYIVNPTSVVGIASRYNQAFAVATGGSNVEDPSAYARVLETAIAIPYIEQHPILGNGVISQQWNGGNEGVLGTYFFEDDIGLFGILFSFGIVGLLFNLYQYRYAITAASQISRRMPDNLTDAIKAFIFFSFLYSVVTGFFVWSGETSLFFIGLLSLLTKRRYGLEEHAVASNVSLPLPL